MSPVSRFARFWSCNGRAILIAAAALGAANISLKLLPFRKVIRGGSRPIGRKDEMNDELVRRWVNAVEGAARRLPWRSVCIHKGLALQWLLRKRGIPAVLHYGAALGESDLRAHVWVTVGDKTVLGGEFPNAFYEISTFPSEPKTLC